ncbi:MAG TPA: hypothetical protein EYQ31_04905 [Candidatus Handelsmanbacteria bacterium]|nr:hypothetical protein [Candidatus Handelsmanbacteria bacterium]
MRPHRRGQVPRCRPARTPDRGAPCGGRGRMATSKAYQHFGLKKPKSPENDLFAPESDPE